VRFIEAFSVQTAAGPIYKFSRKMSVRGLREAGVLRRVSKHATQPPPPLTRWKVTAIRPARTYDQEPSAGGPAVRPRAAAAYRCREPPAGAPRRPRRLNPYAVAMSTVPNRTTAPGSGTADTSVMTMEPECGIVGSPLSMSRTLDDVDAS
jgi:hypothetical protein